MYGDAVLDKLGSRGGGGGSSSKSKKKKNTKKKTDSSNDSALEVLTRAVAKIRNIHSIHPKSGPGRKSNAVHALLFYEYLVDRASHGGAAGGDGGRRRIFGANYYEGNGDGGGGGEDEIIAHRKTSDGATMAGNEEVDDRMAMLSDGEFVRQHRNVCEVCEEPASPHPAPVGNPLLLCSTCDLAFHVPCSRPVLDTLPPDDEKWRCSYCVLRTEPKYTKPRRVAAAAVRLMARYASAVYGLWFPRFCAAQANSSFLYSCID
jgi:hypothetical protein